MLPHLTSTVTTHIQMSSSNLRWVKITYGNMKFSFCLTDKNFMSRSQKNMLVLLREIKDICSDKHTENITTLCEINLELFNVQGSGTYIGHYALNVKWKIWNSDNVFQALRRFVLFWSVLQTQITIFLSLQFSIITSSFLCSRLQVSEVMLLCNS